MDLFMSLLNGLLPNALKNAGSSLRCSMPRWSLNYLLTSAKQLAAGSRSPGKQWRRRWAIRLPPIRTCTTVGLTCATVNKTQKARTNNVWSPRCITAEDNNAAHNVATCWSKQSSISFTFHPLILSAYDKGHESFRSSSHHECCSQSRHVSGIGSPCSISSTFIRVSLESQA